MRSVAKLSSVFLVAAAVTLGCGTEQPAPSKVTEQATGTDTEPNAPEAAAAATGTPKIASDAATHDFGAIKLGDKAEHVFKIRNAGDGVLKIDKVERT